MMTTSSCSRSGRTFRHTCVALLLLACSPFLLGAGDSGVHREGDAAPSRMVATAQQSGLNLSQIEADRSKRARGFMANGTKFFEEADFQKALGFYQQARYLEPNNADLKDLVALTIDNRNQQRRLVSRIETSGEKVSKVVKSRYREACDLFDERQYTAARKEFRGVWLLAGDYRSTLKYLNRIGDAEAQPGAVTTRPAQTERVVADAAAPQDDVKRLKAERKAAEARIKSEIKEAGALVKAAKFDRAIEMYQAVQSRDPDNKVAAKGILRAQVAKADALEESAAQQHRAQMEATRIAQRQAVEKKEAAERAERDALDRKIDEGMARAKAFRKAGDHEQALASYRGVLELDPGSWWAKRGVAKSEAAIADAAEDARRAEIKATEVARRAAEDEAKRVAQAEEKARETEEKVAKAAQRASEEKAQRLAQAEQEARVAESEKLAAEKRAAEVAQKEQQERELAAAAQERKAAAENERQVAEAARKAQEAKIDQGLIAATKAYKQEQYAEAIELYRTVLSMDAGNRKAGKGVRKSESALAQVEHGAEATRLQAVAQAERDAEQTALRAEADEQAHQEALRSAEKEAAEARQLAETEERERQQVALDAERKAEQASLQAARKERDAKIRATLETASDLLKAGDIEGAQDEYDRVLAMEPENKKALKGLGKLAKIEADQAKAESSATREMALEKEEAQAVETAVAASSAPSAVSRKTTHEMLLQADRYYNAQEYAKARDVWQRILDMDPENKTAQTYLEETAEEYERFLADADRKKAATDKEREGLAKLNKPITISTTDSTPLVDFLVSLSYPSGIDFVVSEGREAQIDCNFVDKPLKEILDDVILPKGLKWERVHGDVIQVTADLRTKVFQLNPEQMAKVQILIENATLQRIIYGDEMKPLQGTQLDLEEREGVLIAVDSQVHIDKLAEFLQSLREEISVVLQTKIYTIRESDAEEIKALVEAIVRASKSTPFDLERGVFLSGKNLIVKDTPDNLAKIEDLLADRLLMRSLRKGDLKVSVFDLLPTEALQDEANAAADFFENTKEVIEVLLYAEEGKAKAAEQGRRMWADAPNFQITITDYPIRVRQVSDYLSALRQIEQKKRQQVFFLRHQESADMASQLSSILGLGGTTGAGGSGSGQNQASFNLNNPDREVQFRDLRVRLKRVEENDEDDENDDECELQVRTNTQSSEMTLEEYESDFVDNYEIVATDIRPGGGDAGGRVTITVRYTPPEDDLLDEEEEEVVLDADAPMEPEINSYGNQNALIVSYEDPADLTEISDLILKLDKPTPQVSIETRFVTINEDRAKEFGTKFSVLDRSDPRNIGVGIIDVINGSPQPGNLVGDIATNAVNATYGDYFNLSGVLEDVLGNYLDWEMQMLESEGVLNALTGPHIVVMDGDTASFIIQHQYIDPDNTWTWRDVIDMNVGADVTSEEAILLELDLDIIDIRHSIDNYASGYRYPEMPSDLWNKFNQPSFGIDFEDLQDFGNDDETVFLVDLYRQGGVYQGNDWGSGIRAPRKQIQTTARIKNGGTIVLGGWNFEETDDYTGGIPGLRNLPWVGKMFFSHELHTVHTHTLMIFLSGQIID